MENKGSYFIILLFIIAFLTLTLAALAGYIFLGGGQKAPADGVAVQKEVTVKRPAESELIPLATKLFEGKKYFNLKSADDKKISIIQVNISLKLFNKKGFADKTKSYLEEIREIVSSYFQSMTLEEARQTETRTKAKHDLKKEINNLLNASETNEKKKEDIVYKVIFDEWFFQ